MNIDKKSISIIRKEYAETVKACREAEMCDLFRYKSEKMKKRQ